MIKLQKRNSPSKKMSYFGPLLAIIITTLVAGIVFFIMGFNPAKTIYTFFIEPIKTQAGAVQLLLKASPIILCALGLSFCYRANQWNIGAEGQLIIGGLAAGATALYFNDSEGWYIIYLVILAGILGGMLWALIPALLKVKMNTNEILTSLMLTYIAVQVLQYFIYGPLRDPDGAGFPGSALLNDSTTISLFESTSLHKGVILAPIFAIAVYILLKKHILGYRITLIGFAPAAAKYAGFSNTKITILVFLISGGFAGLAGALEVTGVIGQVEDSISTTQYGFTAIIVVFLGRLNPIGIIFAGLIIALTYLGGESLQSADVNTLRLESSSSKLLIPQAVGDVFQGLILFFLLMIEVLITHKLIIKK